jgi:hypothetical protein
MTAMRQVAFIALACACAAAGFTGCGGTDRIPFPGGCGQPSVRRAWAIEVTAAGRVRWQTPLAAQKNGFGVGTPMSPLAVGAVAVFTQDDVLYGLRLADGHRSWSWASPKLVEGMWRWKGLVVVLEVQRPGSHDMAQLAGLDASTGRLQWTLRIPGDITGDVGVTADGGLAMVRADGVLPHRQHESEGLLYKNCAATALIGLIFLGSCVLARKPLVFYMAQRYGTDGTHDGMATFDKMWSAYHDFRTGMYVISYWWAAVFVIQAAVTALIIRQTRFSTAYNYDQILPLVATGLGIFGSIALGRYFARRGRARAGAVSAEHPGPA